MVNLRGHSSTLKESNMYSNSNGYQGQGPDHSGGSSASVNSSSGSMDSHVVVMRQAEEIRRLRRTLLQVSNERDALLCEVEHLKMEILANELGRMGEVPERDSRGQGQEDVDELDSLVQAVSESIGHLTGTCVDDDVEVSPSIYSSSEMTRLSSSSSSSSASSSPVLFTSSSKSSSTQFHDSSEETGETGVVERRYGGPPARDAALVIQRAFRRYSMVKEFQRIKTERRLSRRINNNVASTPGGGPNGCDICIDLQDSHHHHHHHEEISGEEEEEDSSVHSGELSRSPIPDLAEVDGDLVLLRNGVQHGGSNGHHGTGRVIGGSGSVLTPSHSSPQMLVMMSNGSLGKTRLVTAHRVHQSTDTVPSSRHFTGPGHMTAYTPRQAYNGVRKPVAPGLSSTGSSPQSSISNASSGVKLPLAPRQVMSEAESEILRKRLYRVGLNLFNKKPETGISYLVKKKFLEGAAPAVSRFLISRKGLSKQMVGEYLANLQSPFSMACLEHFANEIDLSSMPIDLALRRFQTFLRMPGEAQKIERVMETFSRRYGACNPHVTSQFRQGADTVFVLAFAIIMLNTDLHTPHLKADRRMKMEDFIKNLRGIDDGGDIDREMLVDIYERIKQTEFRTGSDHVTQVMKVQQTIVGKKPNLALPHRRLVCYCRLYEVADINKKEKSGSHQREVFLFNDILVLTKIFHKKRNSVTYSFRQSYPLSGITLVLFSNQYYEFGLSLRRGELVLLNLNARNDHDRAKFAEDLREAIAESDEMTRIETLSKENRDSGVDVGKIKRYSNSLLDINDQCKPTRRGSCGSLDSGMSISFQSDEAQQLAQQQQLSQSQLSNHLLTTTHPPAVLHQHQGSSCSNSSTSTTHSK